MPFPRKRSPVQFSEQDMLKLESIRKSRTEEKRRTLRAAFLLDSLSGQSDEAIAQHHHVSRSTVVLCIQKFLQFGLDAALGELPRPGKADQGAPAAQVRRQFRPGDAHEIFRDRIGVVRDHDATTFPGNPVEIRDGPFTSRRLPSGPTVLPIVPRQL